MCKVTFVNDCAYTSETIAKYLDKTEFQIKFVTRTRELWSKTFGIAWKILTSRGNIFHVAYALQDAFLTLKLKKQPVIVHVHGSDARKTINSRKWGWIVKSNLRSASAVFVAQPDILEKVYEYTEHATYLPIPIDLSLFKPQPPKDHDKITIFHPYLTNSRGTNLLLSMFRMLELKFPNKYELMLFRKANIDENLKIGILSLKNVKWMNPVKHEEMPNIYGMADIVVSDLKIGVLPTCSLEAMACGKPVIQYIKKGIYEIDNEPPVLDLSKPSTKELYDAIETAYTYPIFSELASSAGRKYVEKWHDAEKVADHVAEVYRELMLSESCVNNKI